MRYIDWYGGKSWGPMFVTIVEGAVDPDREDDLRLAWDDRSSGLPAGLIRSFLLRGENAADWRIVTVWESREAVTTSA